MPARILPPVFRVAAELVAPDPQTRYCGCWPGYNLGYWLVGTGGFEPPTSCSQVRKRRNRNHMKKQQQPEITRDIAFNYVYYHHDLV
jgi:hypothetical protein